METPVTGPTLTVRVPADPNIIRPTERRVVGDLVIPSVHFEHMPGSLYTRIMVQDQGPGAFTVHARVDNGVAGSGVRYRVNHSEQRNADGSYSVSFTPVSRSEYQQGLVGRFPVPDFTDVGVLTFIKGFTLHYRFEIDSPYPSDAVMANFLRLGAPIQRQRGFADPVTGRIFRQNFRLSYYNIPADYTVEVFPFRNGSKAVIHMELPTVENNRGEVDFAQIIQDLRQQLTAIVES